MTINDYRNFDLLITRAGDRYRAFVVDAPAGDASVVFDLPFAADEATSLGGLVRGVTRHVGRVKETSPAAPLTDLGGRLFAAVFRDKVQTLLAASLASVAQEGAGLRLRLRFEEDAANLAILPWETLYDPNQRHFIGLGEQSPILRYLSLPRSRSALLVEPPLRVLALLASPNDLPALDMEREWRAIQEALAELVADGKFVLERLPKPSLEALQERLLGEPVHILHFVGHGVFDESGQSGRLALEGVDGRIRLVQGEQLASLLRNHSAMRLVYLNACEGALASRQSVFTGVAQTLVRQGVPAAVAMQAEITDTGAIELARTFYTALASGRPVDAALTQARVALAASGNAEWAIPVLFSRSPDNRLFDIRAVLPTPDCPYPGMTPFNEAQQALFFGRDREIDEVVERLRQRPFLTVVGPSGSGKSSLIYAGVIPTLRKSKRFGPGAWTVQMMRPGRHPLAALAEKLDCSPGTLSSVTLTERTLLFIDQFEETFALAEAREAEEFLDALQGLIGRPALYVLITVRADFYPELMACSLWQPIRANRLELTPLGDDKLWAAIVEPAAHVGVTVDEALAVQLIADAAGQSGMLPLVQEALVLLWEKVARRQLGLAAYRSMAEGGRSGLQVAIDRRASIIYDNLPDAAQPMARRIFLRLIQFGEGRADTRRQQTVDDLYARGDDPALFDQTLTTLTASRLLTTGGEEGSARQVDIAHEALIAGWPRLLEWLGQRRAAEQIRRRLEGKAAEWLRLEKKSGLLDAYELQEAETWLAGDDARELGFSQDLLDLLAASKAALARAEADKEAQRQREKQQARRLIIVLASGVAAALLLTGLATWFGVDAGRQRNNAVSAEDTAVAAANARATEVVERTRAEALVEEEARQARRALSRQLAVQAQAVVDSSPQRSLLLAMEALAVTARAGEPRVPVAEEALRNALTHAGGRVLHGQDEATNRMTFSAGNRWLVSGSGTADQMGNVSASDLRLWDLASTHLDVRSRLLPGTNGPFAVSNDGKRLVTSDGASVRLWDLTADDPMATSMILTAHVRAIDAIAISPDSRWLVTSSGSDHWYGEFAVGGRVVLWDLATQHPRSSGIVLSEQKNTASVVAFSPDSHWLVTTSWNPFANRSETARVRLWDLTTSDPAARPFYLSGHTSSVSDVAYSADGRWLATSSREYDTHTFRQDATVRVWDLQAADPSASPRILSGHEGSISAIAFSRDGHWLISGGDDRTARVWKLADGDPLVVSNSIVLANHDDAVTSVAMSGDNQWVITMSGPAGRLWDISDSLWDIPNEESNLPSSILSDEAGLPLSITAHAFSADNRLLVAGVADGTARVWDLEAGGGARQPRVLRGHEGAITAVAIRPGNRWVATSGGDKTIRLWNLAGAESIADPLVLPPIAAISPDHRWLVTRSQDHNVAHVWNVTTADPLDNPAILSAASSQSTFLEVAFSPDSHWLMSGDYAGAVRLWDLSGRRSVTQPLTFEGHRRVSALAMSPDQHWFASGDFEGTARVWDLTAADPTVAPVILHPPVAPDAFSDAVYGVRISPDSRWLLIRRGEFSPSQLWELAAPATAPSPVVLGAVDRISFSPDGRWLVVRGNSDERLSLTARIWEIEDRLNAVSDKVEFEELDQELERLREEEAQALPVTRLWDLTAQEPAIALTLLPEEWPISYSPDGRWILTRVADGPLYLRDMTSANPDNDMRVFSDSADLSARIALEPALQWLATDDVTGSTRIQDLLEGVSDSAFLNDASAGDFSLSEDGRWLVMSNDTDSLRLWDTQIDSLAEAPVALSEGMTGGRLIFVKQDAGDYRLLGSSYGSGGNTTLWTLPLDALIALACRTAGRNFSPAEWEQYFPDEPYRKTCRQWPMHPDLTQSLRDEARSLARQGDIAAAAGKFAEALHLDPDLGIDPEAEAKRIYAPTVVEDARALAARGEIIDAQAKFEEALALDPGLGIEPQAEAKRIHALKVVEEARDLAKQGEVVAAQMKVTEALHLDPDLGIDPEAEVKRIYALIHAQQISWEARDLAWQGEIVAAQVKFDEALALDPGLDIEPEAEAKRIYAPKVVEEARDLAKQGDVAAATVKFEEALALDPNLGIEPDQDAMKLAAPALVQQTIDRAQQGAVTDALARLDEVKAIASELDLPGLHLTICSLHSFEVLAKAVADVCRSLADQALVTESYQALANPVTEIEPGLPVTGTVDSLFGDLWTLEVSAGTQATITLSATASSGLDPYLAFYDPGFRLVADTDNIAQGRRGDSALKNLTLTDGGLYWIVAGRCCPDDDQGSTGAYELEATVVSMRTEE